MSKSIYEEAIEILINMGTEFISVPCNPIGEENSDMIRLRDATETYETNMQGVVKALKQAKKQEKLLELYKELAMFLTTAVEDDEDTHAYTFANINNLKEQILELENDRDYF